MISTFFAVLFGIVCMLIYLIIFMSFLFMLADGMTEGHLGKALTGGGLALFWLASGATIIIEAAMHTGSA